MSEVITTSLVIQFSPPSRAHILQAEIDSRPDGYNKGNTSFSPGDSPAYLLFKSNNVAIQQQITTSGTISPLGSGQLEVTDMLTFGYAKEASLSKPALGTPALTVLAGSVPGIRFSGNAVMANEPCVAVVRAVYQARFDAYRINNVPLTLGGETSFPVVVVIIGFGS